MAHILLFGKLVLAKDTLTLKRNSACLGIAGKHLVVCIMDFLHLGFKLGPTNIANAPVKPNNFLLCFLHSFYSVLLFVFCKLIHLAFEHLTLSSYKEYIFLMMKILTISYP